MTAFARAHARRALIPLFLTGLFVSAGSSLVTAQAGARVLQADDQAARRVRDEFIKVLQKYPPTVGGVLKLDPSLMSSEPYMTPYPALVAFLNQHPEIRRSPSYYFEPVRVGSDSYYYDPRSRSWENMTEMLAVLVVIMTIVGALGWTIRTAVDYRRWGRLARVQAEAHTKLLDRFTGNEELLAYVQSPAGSRFLKSSPIALDGSPRNIVAPLSRILWSMQAGIVLATAGLGLNYVSRNIDPDRADPIFFLSVLLLSVGIGFVLSAGLSYLLSKRMGLLVTDTNGKNDQD